MFHPLLWLIMAIFYAIVFHFAGWAGVGTVIGFSVCVCAVLFIKEDLNNGRD